MINLYKYTDKEKEEILIKDGEIYYEKMDRRRN